MEVQNSESNHLSNEKMDRRAMLQQWLMEKKMKKEGSEKCDTQTKPNGLSSIKPSKSKGSETVKPKSVKKIASVKPNPVKPQTKTNISSQTTGVLPKRNQLKALPGSKNTTSLPKKTEIPIKKVTAVKKTSTKPKLGIRSSLKKDIKLDPKLKVPKENGFIDQTPVNNNENESLTFEEVKASTICKFESLEISDKNVKMDEQQKCVEECAIQDETESIKQITLESDQHDVIEESFVINSISITPEKVHSTIDHTEETPSENTSDLLLFPFLKNKEALEDSVQQDSPEFTSRFDYTTPSKSNSQSNQVTETPNFLRTPRIKLFKDFNSIITPLKPTSNDSELTEEICSSNHSSVIKLEKFRAGKNKKILGSEFVVTPVRRSVRFLKGSSPSETNSYTKRLLAESNWAYSPNVALNNVDLPSLRTPKTNIKTKSHKWRQSFVLPKTEVKKHSHESKITQLLISENSENVEQAPKISVTSKEHKKRHRNSECLEFRRVQYSSLYGSTYVIKSPEKNDDSMVTPVRRSRRIIVESAKKEM